MFGQTTQQEILNLQVPEQTKWWIYGGIAFVVFLLYTGPGLPGKEKRRRRRK